MIHKTSSQMMFALLLLLVMAVVAGLSHYFFSHQGFNPTDHEIYLAFAVRLFQGEVPYTDFILLTPPLSQYLLVPIVYAGESMTLYARAFYWGEVALIGYFGSLLIQHFYDEDKKYIYLLAIVTFCLVSSRINITPWPSLDGMIFCLAGFVILFKSTSEKMRFAGYFVLALSYMTKQSFLPVPLIALFIMGDYRQWRYWLAITLPGFLFIGWLVFAGVFIDAFLQITAQKSIVSKGFIRYLWALPSFVLIYLIYYTYGHDREKSDKMVVYSIWAMIVFYLASLALYKYYHGFALVLWGAFLAYSLKVPQSLNRKLWWSLLAMAWGMSLSDGINSPLFGMAILIPLFALGTKKVFIPILALICTLILVGAQLFDPGRERPMAEQTCELGGIVYGYQGVKTNPVTCRYLKETQQLKQKYAQQNKRLFVFVCPSCELDPNEINPIPGTWILDFGAPPTPHIFGKITKAFNLPGIVIGIPKISPASLADDVLQAAEYNTYEKYVRKNFQKIESAEFYDVYAKQ